MARPTILIVPGAWQTHFHYSLLTSSLTSNGYKAEYLSNPSNSPYGPWTASWEDDAANIAVAIKREAALGNEVVLVCHSYGGLPGSEACKGLLIKDFKAKGGRGGVKGLVYISAVALAAGEQVPGDVKGNPDFLVDELTKSTTHARPLQVLYPDLPPPLQVQAVENMVRQSASMLTFRSSFSPWEHVPAHYIFCEKDVSIPIELQRAIAGQPGKWSTSSLDTGHSPQLVCPDEVARFIDNMVQSIASKGKA